MAVNCRIEREELVLKTWYIMQTNLNKSMEYMRKRYRTCADGDCW